MCKTVSEYAASNNVSNVAEIVCLCGELSLVIPKYVEELFRPVADEFPVLKDTRLIIEIIPGFAECEVCDDIFNVVEHEGYCPSCGSFEKNILSGKDFLIKEIHVKDSGTN